MQSISLKDNTLQMIIKSMTTTDILVGAKHPDLVNILWMRPHSVLIEMLPPFCVDFVSMHLAELARLQYFSVTDFDNSHVIGHGRDISYWLKNGLLEENSHSLEQGMPLPPMISLVYAVRDSIEYIKRVANVYLLEDIWSPIFYLIVCFKHHSFILLVFRFFL